MKSLVFDSSTIITIVVNNLLEPFKKLKVRFNGEFFIPLSVKKEIVDYPITTKKFKLEAIMVLDAIKKNYLKVYEDPAVTEKAYYLLELANRIYFSRGEPIKILDMGEVEALALAVHLNSDAYVVDERTMRLIIENPNALAGLLSAKLHLDITIDNKNLKEFQMGLKGIKVIRSTELMVMAYELGLFDEYLTDGKVVKRNLRPVLLDGLLWGLKLNGCSISTKEIEDIIRLES